MLTLNRAVAYSYSYSYSFTASYTSSNTIRKTLTSLAFRSLALAFPRRIQLAQSRRHPLHTTTTTSHPSSSQQQLQKELNMDIDTSVSNQDELTTAATAVIDAEKVTLKLYHRDKIDYASLESSE